MFTDKPSGLANEFGLDFLTSIRSYMIPPLYNVAGAQTIKLEDENTIIKVYHGGNDNFDYGYLPFQMRQQCYHTATGNVRCSPLGGGHNTRHTTSFGYGGGQNGAETDTCPGNYNYLGSVCTRYPVNIPESFEDADKVCADTDEMVYFSRDKVQNLVFKTAMEKEVRHLQKL